MLRLPKASTSGWATRAAAGKGDTLVVDVKNHNDRTWFDMAGNFHSEALHLVERYTMRDANTIDYEVTIEDPKVFTRPWTISMPLHRQTDADRIFEYQCQAEAEEASGAFEPDPKTWYPGPSVTVRHQRNGKTCRRPLEGAGAQGPIKRMPDGKPDLQGYFMPDGGGANYGLGKHEQDFLTPGGRGVIVDPPDGNLPMQAWAKAEVEEPQNTRARLRRPDRALFRRRSPALDAVPSPLQILQPPGYIVILHERMSWRTIPLDGRAPPARPFTIVARRFDRPLGRRYARRRDDEPEWEERG